MGFSAWDSFLLAFSPLSSSSWKKESTIYLYTVETIENATRGELQPD